jgi:ketosteroid isomerase-like protein
MTYLSQRSPGRVGLGCALLVALVLQAAHADPAADAVATVRQFNEAIGARDMDTAMAALADGSVQLQLRAIHPGMSDSPPLTADLKKNWQLVGAILFPMTNAYTRELTVTKVIAEGDIATVWTETTTRTERKQGADTPTEQHFSEVYLLVRKPGGWKIAVVADNRQPDNVVIGPAEAQG